MDGSILNVYLTKVDNLAYYNFSMTYAFSFNLFFKNYFLQTKRLFSSEKYSTKHAFLKWLFIRCFIYKFKILVFFLYEAFNIS